MHPKHIDVSTAFTGTGSLVIDLNTLTKHIITHFNLSKESVPVFTLLHAFNYIISNLHLTFDDITIVNFTFMQNDSYLHLLSIFLENHINTATCNFLRIQKIETYEQLQYFIEEERIALCVSSEILLTYFLSNGIYTAILDDLEFRMPSAYMFVYEPYFQVTKKNKNDIKKLIIEEIEKSKAKNSKETVPSNKTNCKDTYNKENNVIMFCLDVLSNKSEKERKIEEETVKCMINSRDKLLNIQIYNENIDTQEDLCYQIERVTMHNSNIEKTNAEHKDNKTDKESIATLKEYNKFVMQDNVTEQLKKYISVKNELDLSIHIPKKKFVANHQKQTFHLQVQAESLYGDLLKVTDINKKEKTEMKITSKQKKLIDENKKRLEVENQKKENVFLKNIFERYKNATHEQRKNIIDFETLEIYSTNIQVKIMLLKIECYYKEWEIEQRKEEVNEGALVPCYLACLELINMIKDENYKARNKNNECSDNEKRNNKEGHTKNSKANTKNSNKENIKKHNLKKHNVEKHNIEKHNVNVSNSTNHSNNKDIANESVLPEQILFDTLIFDSEFSFAIQKLIECGFESTALEILENTFNAKIIKEKKDNFKFSMKCKSKPNDKDIYFQMKYAGDKLKRTLHGKSDSRVLFTPDGWQIKLLDMVDQNKSAVVCAPTSSGKTFITFYAIEKVLRESDKDIVIFCLPTKALANQVMADVYARFSCKTYKTNKVLQGILMPDFKTNAYNCQVLITVPSMLESLLKTLHNMKDEAKGSNFAIINECNAIKSTIKKSMSNEFVPEKINIMQKIKKELQESEDKKGLSEDDMIASDVALKKNNFTLDSIKYIIIDEVHKIGSDEMGGCIERVIHLSPSPLLILSATLGNFSGIYEWISKIEERKGREVGLVMHNERYCELKPYVYKKSDINVCDINVSNVNACDSSSDDDKNGVTDTKDNNNVENINKANDSILVPINPLFAFTYQRIKQYGFSNDISFLPEELLDIYYAIFAVLKKDQKHLIQEMRPKNFFKSNILTKKDIKLYETYVIDKFTEWIKSEVISDEQLREMYDYIVKDTYQAFNDDTTKVPDEVLGEVENDSNKIANELQNDTNNVCVNTNEIEIDTKKVQTDIMNDTVEFLENNIENLVMHLKSKNLLPCIIFNSDRHVCNSLAKKVYDYLEKEEMNENIGKDKKKERFMKDQKRNRDKEILNKDNWIDESIFEAQNVNLLKNEKKNIKYCFFESLYRKSDYELKDVLKNIYRDDPMLMDIIYRGIGVHHNGINKKLRAVVENLFRKKHITVLFSTETLSLGINMPCRTVVFAGDNIKLDIISYKQMAGRAGRRGFDTLGNVIFYGFDKRKIQNLIIGGLCNLKGKYSYTSSSLINSNCMAIESLINDSLYALTYKEISNMNSNSNSSNGNSNNINSSNLNSNNLDGNNDRTLLNSTVTTSKTKCNERNDTQHSTQSNNIANYNQNLYNLGDFIMQPHKRRMLINYQIQNIVNNYYKFDIRKSENYTQRYVQNNFVDNMDFLQHLPNTVFSDFILGNKNYDPFTFVFLSLFYVNNNKQSKVNYNTFFNTFFNAPTIFDNYSPLQWMHLFSHFFGVRYTKNEKYSLKPITNSEIRSVIDKVNEDYIKSISLIQTKELNYLQKMVSKPLFKIPSFFYIDDCRTLKNSYLVDFFENSNIYNIRERNRIDTGELYKNLADIAMIAEDLIKVLQDKNCVRGLKVFYEMLREKIGKIAA